MNELGGAVDPPVAAIGVEILDDLVEFALDLIALAYSRWSGGCGQIRSPF